jgi:hypothetical protein
MPFYTWPGAWFVPLVFTALSALLIAMPLQRKAFESLLGTSFQYQEKSGAPSRDLAGQYVAHATLFALAIFVACSAAINYSEQAQYRRLTQSTMPQWHSPAETNAYNALKQRFLRTKVTPEILARPPASSGAMLQAFEARSPATRETAFQKVNREEFQQYAEKMQPYVHDFTVASEADYLTMPGVQVPSFLAIRETARLLAKQSLLDLREGKGENAAQNVKTLIRFGGLLANQPFLVMQMIGVAVRNISIQTAYVILAQSAGNLPVLTKLLQVLRENETLGRKAVSINDLRVGELGFDLPIVPNMEIAVPAMHRALTRSLISWANFDLVEIGTALELCKARDGNYPDRLEELVPAYLPGIPRDPITGHDYQYHRTADGDYKLARESADGSSKNSDQLLRMSPWQSDAADSTKNR